MHLVIFSANKKVIAVLTGKNSYATLEFIVQYSMECWYPVKKASREKEKKECWGNVDVVEGVLHGKPHQNNRTVFSNICSYFSFII